jgi:hypothetical protein
MKQWFSCTAILGLFGIENRIAALEELSREMGLGDFAGGQSGEPRAAPGPWSKAGARGSVIHGGPWA